MRNQYFQKLIGFPQQIHNLEAIMDGKRTGTFFRADAHEIETWLRSPKSPLYGSTQTVVAEKPMPTAWRRWKLSFGGVNRVRRAA